MALSTLEPQFFSTSTFFFIPGGLPLVVVGTSSKTSGFTCSIDKGVDCQLELVSESGPESEEELELLAEVCFNGWSISKRFRLNIFCQKYSLEDFS